MGCLVHILSVIHGLGFENILSGDSLMPARISLKACMNSEPLECEACDQEQEVG